MKRAMMVIMATFLLIGCTVTEYYYVGKPLNNDKDYRNYVTVSTSLGLDDQNENSLIKVLRISDGKNTSIEILSPTIMVLYRNKKYTLRVDKKYKNIVHFLEQDVKINGEFIAYIGKVRLSNGKVLNIPPIKFNKYVHIFKYNAVNDVLNKHEPNKKIFSGTVEDFKKGNK